MKKRKFKHSKLFQTKDDLRRECAQALSDYGNEMHRRNEAENRATRLAVENNRLTQKVVSDSFMIQELKAQISQQHIQLCNIRENENVRQQQLAHLAPVAP